MEHNNQAYTRFATGIKRRDHQETARTLQQLFNTYFLYIKQTEEKKYYAHHTAKINTRTSNFYSKKDINHTNTSCTLFAYLLVGLHYHYANPNIKGGRG